MLATATSEKNTVAPGIAMRKKSNPFAFFAPATIQPKLTVGPVNDPHEKEADAMANRVLRMPMQEGSRSPTVGNSASFFSPSPIPVLQLQRSCSACEKEELRRKEEEPAEEERMIQRKEKYFDINLSPATGNVQRDCAACEEEKKVELKGESGARGGMAAPPIVHDVIQSAGQPMDAAARSFMEPRFGFDFGNVRIHTGSKAADSSAAINAQAYTAGNNIVFGNGKYDTRSGEGKRLLAHELTHVVQQNSDLKPSSVQRDCDPSMMSCQEDNTSSFLGDTSDPANAVQPGFDPCEVNVSALTNEALVNYLDTARTYLHARKRGEDDYFAYANLMSRLAKARQERMKSGHIWLADDLSAMPDTLYQLSTGQYGEIQINLADISVESGLPAPVSNATSIVTPSQFDHFLEVHNIPGMNPEAYFQQAIENKVSPGPFNILPPLPDLPAVYQFLNLSSTQGQGFDNSLVTGIPGLAADGASMGVIGGNTYNSPFSLLGGAGLSAPVFSQNVRFNNPRSVMGARNKWRGNLPELLGTTNGYGLFNQDLNAIQNNFPIFDLRSRFSNNLISVKSVVPTNINGPVNLGTYTNGFRDMVGNMRPNTLVNSTNLLNANLNTSATTIDSVRNAYLAVNNDHVSLVQDAVEKLVKNKPGDYVLLLDALLSADPVKINNTSYASWNDLLLARQTGNIQVADLTSVQDVLAQKARLRVIGSGMTTDEMRSLLAFREQFQGIPQQEFRNLAAPEVIEAERFGGGFGGMTSAMRNAAIRGGAQGGLVSVLLTTGSSILNNDYRDFGTKLSINAASGVFGGALGSTIETPIMASLSRNALDQYLARTITEVPNMTFLRAGASGIAGGITAPLATMAAMGLEELFTSKDYIYIDYLAKGTRAIPSGAIAGAGGALAAGGVGAAAGTEVPIAGNIAGFIVGLGIYYLSDYLIGDTIEEDVRLSLGEGGCPRPEPIPIEAYTDYSGVGVF